jgi:hypothetical protein
MRNVQNLERFIIRWLIDYRFVTYRRRPYLFMVIVSRGICRTTHIVNVEAGRGKKHILKLRGETLRTQPIFYYLFPFLTVLLL